MKISVFGLGYVGTVTAAYFAMMGHDVIGVDINREKIQMIEKGQSPVTEYGLDHWIYESVMNHKLTVTEDHISAILATNISIICVGTPSSRRGDPDLRFIKNVIKNIGIALRQATRYHTICIRSTVLPGTTEKIIIPLLEKYSGLILGKSFGIVFNPEFLREGNALSDFQNPARTIIGEYDQQSGDCISHLFSGINAPEVRTNIRIAELIKYADNAFHALKVGFSNEISAVCQAHGIDSRSLMDVFCLDTKLNISAAYLKPGPAFGGSCLPKDIRAINYQAKKLGISTPILESINKSNDAHKKRMAEQILAFGKKNIGILGLSFKLGTDDLRESPSVEMVQYLIERGCDVKIYDNLVSGSRLLGANKKYISEKIPQFSDLVVPDIKQVIRDSDIIVITQENPEFLKAIETIKDGQIIIDLVGTGKRAI